MGVYMNIQSRILVAVAACATATGAFAQIGNVTSTTGASQTLGGVTTNFANPAPSPKYNNGGPGGAGFSASADISGDAIFFQAGSMAAGKGNAATSEVTVSFDVTNPGATAITQLRSTIFESNFGFYATNFGGGAIGGQPLPNCSGVTLPTCVATTFGSGFSDFTDSAALAPPRTLATTQFEFIVKQDSNVVRAVSGSLAMIQDVNGDVVFTPGLGFSELSSVLSNFRLFEVSDRVFAYTWDRTNFTANLNAILEGQTSNLSYTIRTATFNFAESDVLPPTANQIVAFSCFADPIGRGTSGSMFVIPNFGPSTCNNYGGDGSVTPYSLKVPQIIGDTLDFTAPAIPEPDTWAMLIIGFGLVGLSMRRGKSAPTMA